ncbi:MAG: exosortase/archaeosortase family protein [Planctomycetota bacterium]|nr:exosortase/archaeosortase family protein [Planctomycetota bacterium]
MTDAPTSDPAESPPDEGWLVPRPIAIGIAGLAICAAIGFAFRDFFVLQYHYATKEAADWGHTLFVPLIALYVVLLHKSDLVSRPFRTGWSGLGLILIGIGWYAFTWIGPDSSFINSHNVRSIGVFLALLGCCVAILGWRSLVWLWFPLLYILIFGQRITDKVLLEITYPMQDIATWGSWHALDLLGYDLTERKGNAIEIILAEGGTYPLDVAEACSGMRMLMAFLALGTIIAYVGLDRWWLRLVLILSGIPIAIAINVLRICTLGILGLQGEEFMFGEFHALVGLIWMIPTFGLYMLLMWFLQPLDEDEDGNRLRRGAGSAETKSTAPARFGRHAVPAAIATIALLLTGGMGVNAAVDALGLHIVKKPVQPRAPLNTVPATLGPWQQVGEDQVFRDTVVEVLGTETYLQRQYAIEGDPRNGVLTLHLAYYTDLAGTAPHVPERCWSVHGGTSLRRPNTIALDLPETGRTIERIHQGSGEPYRVVPFEHPVLGPQEIPLPSGPIALRTTMFTYEDDPSIRQLGGYFFVANGRTTDSALAVENVAFDLTSPYGYYCKVQLNQVTRATGDDDRTLARFQEQASGFMAELLPHLATVLPDWRDYESVDGVVQADLSDQADSSDGTSVSPSS